MSIFVKDSVEIAEFINKMTLEDVPEACSMLNYYWDNNCEHTVCYFYFLCWTFHNHAAKSAWAKLDHKLRLKIRLLHGDHQ